MTVNGLLDLFGFAVILCAIFLATLIFLALIALMMSVAVARHVSGIADYWRATREIERLRPRTTPDHDPK